jgi:hypothetical protein
LVPRKQWKRLILAIPRVDLPTFHVPTNLFNMMGVSNVDKVVRPHAR